MIISKVMLVDDDDDIRRLGQISLEMVGRWSVVMASSGQEALLLASEEAPDIVLLDVTMPEMDGVTTYAKLRAIPSMGDVPIIFLTAKVLPGEVDGYLSLGATAVIAKPFDPMTLPDTIREIFR